MTDGTQVRTSVGVVFGGESVEHEVSVITGLQVAAALDASTFDVVPVYIAKDGSWYTGEHLLDVDIYTDLKAVILRSRRVLPKRTDLGSVRLVGPRRRNPFLKPPTVDIDVFLLALHGAEGENGSIQGLMETLNVAYTGSGPAAAAIGMDKVISKALCAAAGIPVVPHEPIRHREWVSNEEAILDRVERRFGYPAVVKPARLGSSIGIERVTDRAALDSAIEAGFGFDEKVVVEYCVPHLREINCSVLGDPDDARASVLEEPVGSDAGLLSYSDKYQSRGDKSGQQKSAAGAGMAALDRVIPANIPEARAVEIQDLAVRVFKLLECSGVARIDFLMDGESGELFFNEINTIPGSFSFYLWEPSGLPFDRLAAELIDIAWRRFQIRNAKTRSYDTNLLAENALRGFKGK